MKSTEIRTKFFDFFIEHGHTKVPSSSLIPAHDPTLLFTNAGMNQFKDIFLGTQKRSYKRAVSIQKCVRAGGKHNDLDNVGFTKRHLTFFEMMGNFSFGDYFKKDAIIWAWEFITKQMGLPAQKLHVAVYETDDESYKIWQTVIGLPAEKIHRLGKDENFWQMGDLGPCGPCTEIFIDRGPDYGCKDPCGPACECDRFLELWNLVFIEFDLQKDGSLKPLTQKGVDTGMGLERLCTIMQHKDSVYETDLFMPIIKKTETLTGHSYDTQSDELKAAFRVVADHIRSSTMIISDGGAPSNEGRGYVLRKIIRRGALFAQKLTSKNIFPQLARVVIAQYGAIYPELKGNERTIIETLTSEIEKFAVNLTRGTQILEDYLQENVATKRISGKQAFKLYDTFGFPIELVYARAREKGYTVDHSGFEKAMEKQQAQSGKKTTDPLDHIAFEDTITTQFTGYDEHETSSEIIALVKELERVDNVPAGSTCWVVAKKSPFFIVGGGQVPDTGWVQIADQKIPIEQVRYINGRIAAQIKTPIALNVGDKITSIVNKEWRINAMKNHTATHLLQAALIELFGKQIKQSGSLVHPDYLRFDFTYHKQISPDQIKQIEDIVNDKIRQNIPVAIEYSTFKQAIDRGVLAFFGEKYTPEKVRIVTIPDFSMELCGGTHVEQTGDIGIFKITEVTSIAAGQRRIVALTGPKALALFQQIFMITKNISQHFNVSRDQVIDQIEKQTDTLKKTTKQLKQLQHKLWQSTLPEWHSNVQRINDIPFLFLRLPPDTTHEQMREIAQLLQTQPGIYMLLSTHNDRTLFLTSCAESLRDKINMQQFATYLNEMHGLRGGGSKGMIQGSGKQSDPTLKEAVSAWLKKQI